MKFLIPFLMLAPTLGIAATDDDVYALLEQNGAYVECSPTTAGCMNKIELVSMQCYRRDSHPFTACTFVDSGRPKETQSLPAAAAEKMLDALLQGGVPSTHAFLTLEIDAVNLRCEKNFGGPAKCAVLKPLFAK